MAEKSAKKKPKKSAKSRDASVLGTLSSTRPTRLGGDRRGTAATAATKSSATKSSAAKQTAAANSTATGGGTKARAAKAGAKRPAKPASKPPRAEAPPAGWQVPGDGDERRDSGRAELVTTAVQAAGEVAQLGLTVGGQLLRRVTGRIPGR
jgi:hypothetical protein